MAEAFVKLYGDERVIVNSAGLDPSPLHPYTIEVMKEIGIDISANKSKKIDMKIFMDAKIIVKLCLDIVERCPVVPFLGRHEEQWNIEDPLSGNPISIDAVRKVRDEIREKILLLLQKYQVLADGAHKLG
jgi:Protein-tyrosine-phosphatase